MVSLAISGSSSCDVPDSNRATGLRRHAWASLTALSAA